MFTTPGLVTACRSILGPQAESWPRPSQTNWLFIFILIQAPWLLLEISSIILEDLVLTLLSEVEVFLVVLSNDNLSLLAWHRYRCCPSILI